MAGRSAQAGASPRGTPICLSLSSICASVSAFAVLFVSRPAESRDGPGPSSAVRSESPWPPTPAFEVVAIVPTSGDPRVTVFIAAYNREALIGEAIASVLRQTFRDFELLVIDDGSSDASADVVERHRDPRIRLVRQPENRGIPRTRNHGLSLARGEYFAILDSDDVAFRTRLQTQVAFLDAHRDVAAVGSWATRIRSDGRHKLPVVRPTGPRDIRARVPFTTCFKNPTMMARTAAMREFGYRDEFVICQDIDLWSRMSAKYPLANLPRFLIRYRLGGSSHQDEELAARMKKRTAADQLRDLGVAFDEDDLERHYQLRNPKKFLLLGDYVAWSADWLDRLLAANRASRCYPEPEFTLAAAERWWRLGLVAAASGLSLAPFYRHADLGGRLPAVLRDVVGLAASGLHRRSPPAGA